jgi:predicted enzyme related to lactoylglutathione lyase
MVELISYALRPGEGRKSIAPRWISHGRGIDTCVPSVVVHLELHTPNLGRACAFYAGLLGWRPERVESAGASYQALDLGEGVGGGVVECGTERALWLPYVEVDSVPAETERARRMGAYVMLAPREGPTGWRSVVSSPAGGEIALWQPKCRSHDRDGVPNAAKPGASRG